MIQTFSLGLYEKEIARGLAELASGGIISRIWEKDWTVWKDDPAEIANRLGWLTSPQDFQRQTARFRACVDDVLRYPQGRPGQRRF